jgi:tRNA(His) guanylyltransferase
MGFMHRATFEDLGDKHKEYERACTDVTILPGVPFLVRVDGRAFHTLTRGFDKPFDANFNHCMVETTKFLIEKTHATIGYTQSDEISLGFLNPVSEDNKTPAFFGGKLHKICSITAALATAKFNQLLAQKLPEKADSLPVFDSRVWSVPNLDVAAEYFMWREEDATRNSIAMAAHTHFSASELKDKNRSAQIDMLYTKGINWNAYSAGFKRGTYVRRTTEMRHLTEAELARIPEDRRPTEPVMRGIIVTVPLPPVRSIKNLAEVLFYANNHIIRTT